MWEVLVEMHITSMVDRVSPDTVEFNEKILISGQFVWLPFALWEWSKSPKMESDDQTLQWVALPLAFSFQLPTSVCWPVM